LRKRAAKTIGNDAAWCAWSEVMKKAPVIFNEVEREVQQLEKFGEKRASRN
jgi:hypothetical protein